MYVTITLLPHIHPIHSYIIEFMNRVTGFEVRPETRSGTVLFIEPANDCLDYNLYWCLHLRFPCLHFDDLVAQLIPSGRQVPYSR